MARDAPPGAARGRRPMGGSESSDGDAGAKMAKMPSEGIFTGITAVAGPAKALPRAMSFDSELQRRADTIRAAFKRPAWWVLIFGWSLAACAGIVNAVSFRSFGHFVSHATGATTSIALGIEGFADGRHGWDEPSDAIKLLGSFLAGAYLCGLLIDKNQVRVGGKALYGAALVGNALLLTGAIAILELTHHRMVAACCAACACGLQNAMCTSHFGAVVRTTHVTGTLTDIGSTTGRVAIVYIRRLLCGAKSNIVERAEVGVDLRKLLVLLPMWTSFFAGTFLGAALQGKLGVYALVVPAALTFCVGLAYMLFRKKLKTRFKRLEQNRLRKDLGKITEKITRTTDLMAEAKKNETTGPGLHHTVQELQQEFVQMLAAMRQVEAELSDLCQRTSTFEPHGDDAQHHVEAPPRQAAAAPPRAAPAAPPRMEARVSSCSAKE